MFYSAALQRTGSAADCKPDKYRLETACSLISGVMTNGSNQYLLSYTKMVRDELKQTIFRCYFRVTVHRLVK